MVRPAAAAGVRRDPSNASPAGALAPVDAIHVKVRDGQVGNRPFYAAICVDLSGQRDVLGLWAGTAGHGESAKFWMSVLTEIKNRGWAMCSSSSATD